MLKILSIIGARPQFIKAAPVSREISRREGINEVILHTGQHFDKNMSDVFFKQLDIPEPDYNLGINMLKHGAMTGRMMEKAEEIIEKEKPDWTLVYGDTNSTLAGSLAAKKLHIRTAHVEAGLRSFNMRMPEEINRIVTDRISDLLFCPTEKAVENLMNEGYDNMGINIVNCGDVMYDAALYYSGMSRKPAFEVPEEYILATMHREENITDPVRLKSVIDALNRISGEIQVIMPMHPGTRKVIENQKIKCSFEIIDPVGYLEMVYLLKNCKLVMTDSGGMQKEAYFFHKPCVTLRDETEWVELVENGYNIIAGSNKEKIYECYRTMSGKTPDYSTNLYGTGKAAEIIVDELAR